MASGRTYYEILGLGRDAPSVDIAAAFREKLAEARAKPDATPESLDALREAYQVLANPEARRDYDRSLPGASRARAPVAREPEPPPVPLPPGAMDVSLRDHLRDWKVFVPLAAIVLALIWWKVRPKPVPVPQYVATPSVYPDPTPPPPAEPAKDAKEVKETKEAPGAASAPPAAPAAAAQASSEELFAQLAASIARIQTLDDSGRVTAQGSGVVVGRGLIITSCQVVKRVVPEVISVKVGKDTNPGTILVADEVLDLCSVRVNGLTAPYVMLDNHDDVRVGQRVYAYGAPYDVELSATEGAVAAMRPTANGTIIQTTAPISPGSSGGGLFNARGELIGILAFPNRAGQNLHFAMPATWITEMKARAGSTSQ